MILSSILSATVFVLMSVECFRVLQATSYRPQRGYVKVLLTPYFLSLIALQVGVVFLNKISVYFCVIAEFAVGLFWALWVRKAPLKITKRIVRTMAMHWVISFLLCFFVGNVYLVWAQPLLTVMSYILCLPVDIAINKHYLRKACDKLYASSVKVIAITGSYGKTSVKDMLATLLDKCIAPGGSCNTPLGIARFINQTDLSAYNYVVLEFGARRKGDIAELCRLYKPTYGIVAGICAQHLSTFKSLKNVIETKRELVEGIPASGVCVLNAYDDTVRSFSEFGACTKILSDDGLNLAINKVDYDGSDVVIGAQGESYSAHFPQISSHIISLATMAIRMCIVVNQKLSTTISRIVSLKQTKHRQEITFNGSFYILDDSYNGSIAGVKSCCETLGYFHCRKVAISQGLVECGGERCRLNEECGRLLGNACDFVVVIGKNRKDLVRGLSEVGCGYAIAKNLKTAVAIAQEYVCGGIVLFQNDLPDVASI